MMTKFEEILHAILDQVQPIAEEHRALLHTLIADACHELAPMLHAIEGQVLTTVATAAVGALDQSAVPPAAPVAAPAAPVAEPVGQPFSPVPSVPGGAV